MSAFTFVGLLVIMMAPFSQSGRDVVDPCGGMGCPGVPEKFALIQNLTNGPSPAEVLADAVLSKVQQFDFRYRVEQRQRYIDATLFGPNGQEIVTQRHLTNDAAISPTPYFHIEPRGPLSRIFRFDLPEIFTEDIGCEYTCTLFSKKTILGQVPYVVREARPGMIDGKTFVLLIENSRNSEAVFSISCLSKFLGGCISA